MPAWLAYSLVVVALWGIVGLLQKLGTSRISARSLLVWVTAGYALLLPWLWQSVGWSRLPGRDLAIGLLAGLTNALGALALFASLERGAKASVAVPLTALNPLLTLLLARVFLSERLAARQWLGVGLAVLAGVLIARESVTGDKSHVPPSASSRKA